ncbi:hypothetical protein [Hymenobacter negativus]|uniref:hypothetical protein n=1 Tax=Hymenobacter negativus TaxID=2795026 RepID=UPI001E456FA7|nr:MULTISPECIES: hypothetical protein [Bacteria]
MRTRCALRASSTGSTSGPSSTLSTGISSITFQSLRANGASNALRTCSAGGTRRAGSTGHTLSAGVASIAFVTFQALRTGYRTGWAGSTLWTRRSDFALGTSCALGTGGTRRARITFQSLRTNGASNALGACGTSFASSTLGANSTGHTLSTRCPGVAFRASNALGASGTRLACITF